MSSAVIAQPLPEPLPVLGGASPVPRPWLAQVMDDTVGRAGARFGLLWIGVVGFMAVFAPFIANSHPYFLKTNDAALVRRFGHASSPLLEHLSGADVTLLAVTVAAIVLWFNRRLGAWARILLITAVVGVVAPAAHWKPLLDYLRDLPRVWSVAAASATAAGSGKALIVLGLVALSLILLADVAVLILIFVRSAAVPRAAKIGWLVALAAASLVLVIFPVDPPSVTDYSQYRVAEAAGHVQAIVRAPIPFSPTDRLRDQFVADKLHPWPPERGHPMGTDLNGADILSRMIHACRIAMSIGFIATGIAIVVGVIVGGLMGYFVGWVDLIGMRLVEIFNAIPTLYLLLAFVAFFPRSLYMMMVIIGLTTWPSDARFVRAEFLRLRDQDFVHAAKAAGLPLRSILFRHMLPNALAPLLVSASFGVASAILIESTLSYLGLGLVDEPSWGGMLNQAVSESGTFNWWLAMFPGAAIFLTVFAYNLIGEAVRDALDPKLKGVD